MRKSREVQQAGQKDKWKDWYEAFLDVKQGMSKGHRWTNQSILQTWAKPHPGGLILKLT